MPLGKEVGLGPGLIVLDGDPVGTQRSRTASPSPLFGACLWLPISATAELLFKVTVITIDDKSSLRCHFVIADV